MEGVGVPLLAVAIGIAAVCLLQHHLTRSGAAREMGPNRLVGIKTRATLASADAWARGHAAAQPALLAAAVTGLGAGVPLALVHVATGGVGGAGFVVACASTTVAVLVLVGVAVGRANGAARRSRPDGEG